MLFRKMQHVYNGTLINLHAEGKENAEAATDMDSRTQHYAMRERRFAFPAITADEVDLRQRSPRSRSAALH